MNTKPAAAKSARNLETSLQSMIREAQAALQLLEQGRYDILSDDIVDMATRAAKNVGHAASLAALAEVAE